jgi:hypothetical protein
MTRMEKAVTKLLTTAAVFLTIGAAAPVWAGTSFNALTPNGLSANGVSLNALAPNGVALNGIALNGATLEDVVATLIEVQLPR